MVDSFSINSEKVARAELELQSVLTSVPPAGEERE